MKQLEYITVLDLYRFAKDNALLNARIRICDGMAVSYYPDPRALQKGRYEVILDVSANEPIEYDELDQWAQRQYENDRFNADFPVLASTDSYTAPPAAQSTGPDYNTKRMIVSGYGRYDPAYKDYYTNPYLKRRK